MAKTIKITNALYDVTADVVVKSDKGIEVVPFGIEDCDTKSQRWLMKTIRKAYESEGLTVLAIDGLTTVKRIVTTTYVINATSQEILDACMTAGLSVSITTDDGKSEEGTEE